MYINISISDSCLVDCTYISLRIERHYFCFMDPIFRIGPEGGGEGGSCPVLNGGGGGWSRPPDSSPPVLKKEKKKEKRQFKNEAKKCQFFCPHPKPWNPPTHLISDYVSK